MATRGKGIKSLDQNSTSVKQQLDILGKDIVTEAKRIVKSEHYDTGQLYRSLKYKTVYINDNKFSLVIEEIYYGQYVNNMKPQPGFMDRAIENNIDSGIDDIVNAE